MVVLVHPELVECLEVLVALVAAVAHVTLVGPHVTQEVIQLVERLLAASHSALVHLATQQQHNSLGIYRFTGFQYILTTFKRSINLHKAGSTSQYTCNTFLTKIIVTLS